MSESEKWKLERDAKNKTHPKKKITVDKLTDSAAKVIFETGIVSVSILQRRLNLGYARAASLIDDLEEIGVVGQFMGSKFCKNSRFMFFPFPVRFVDGGRIPSVGSFTPCRAIFCMKKAAAGFPVTASSPNCLFFCGAVSASPIAPSTAVFFFTCDWDCCVFVYLL